MKYQVECQCCGHRLTAYAHKLNKMLVKGLEQLVEFYDHTKSPANLQEDLDLTKNQYNNFQKLQYFNLVFRTKEGYFPTNKGIAFINGRACCWDRVATMGKKVLSSDHEAWDTTEKKPKLVMAKDIADINYKRRDEYQEEKSRQPNLLEV